eukprot:scaffold25868_cov113-Cylindrotheca_fusiformis.AAC.2
MAPFSSLSEQVDCTDISLSCAEAKHSLHCPEQPKAVSFSRLVKVQEVLSVRNYTDDEINKTWYSGHELSLVKEEAKLMVRRMAKGEAASEDGEWTFRGLEGRTKAGQKEKFHHRRFSKGAVFIEQDEQEENCINDPEKLADIYHEHTEYCQLMAAAIGSRDAAEAKGA